MRVASIHAGYGLTVILAGTSVLLLLFSIVEWSVINNRLEPGKIGTGNDANSSITSTRIDREGFSLAEQESFTEIVERPLFLEDRKPLEDQPEDPGDSPLDIIATKLGAKLMGVYSSEEGLIALILRSDGKYSRVIEGDEVDGWLVKQMHADRIVFAQGNSTEELKLHKPRPKKSTRATRNSRKSKTAKRRKKPVTADRSD